MGKQHQGQLFHTNISYPCCGWKIIGRAIYEHLVGDKHTATMIKLFEDRGYIQCLSSTMP